jgi:hypothetical protein
MSYLKHLQIKTRRTIILLIALYGCETWSLTAKEVLRIMGQLHNKELNNLYSEPNNVRIIKSRTMNWTRRETCIEAMRNS